MTKLSWEQLDAWGSHKIPRCMVDKQGTMEARRRTKTKPLVGVLKTDSRGRCIPCHADVVEDLVRRVAAPAAKAKFY